jgi:hypothetical protein
MSPAELLDLQKRGSLTKQGDPEVSALVETFGDFGSGLMTSWTGRLGVRAGMMFGDSHGDEAYMVPLNFETKPQRNIDISMESSQLVFDEVGKWHLPSQKNNIEGIADDLTTIDPASHGWILGASSYGEYLDRLDYARIASPEFAEKAGTLGKVVGTGADIAAVVSLSLLAEPLVFAGMGARMRAAGQTIADRMAVERYGSIVRLSEEAAEASMMVGRLSGMGRYAMLGVIENTALEIAKNNIDPLYEPESGSIVFDSMVAMGIGGAIGGFAARGFVKDQIERYAQNFRHQATIGGNMVVNFHTPLAFIGNAAADRTLLGAGAEANFASTIDDISDGAWTAYSSTGREFVPGTQSLSLPILQGENAINLSEDVGAQLLGGAVRPSAFGTTMYTPANLEFVDVLLNNGRRSGYRGQRAAVSGMERLRGAFRRSVARADGVPQELRPSGVVFTNRRGARTFAAGLGDDVNVERTLYEGGTGRPSGIEIEFDAASLRGEVIPAERLFEAATAGDVAFRNAGNWRTLSRAARGVRIAADADPAEAARVVQMLRSRGWTRAATTDGSRLYRAPGAAAPDAFTAGVNGVESRILNIVAELQRRGAVVSQDMTRAVGRALLAANREGLRGAAFEARVWSTIERFVDPRVAERIREGRARGNVVPIRAIDQSFDDVVRRQETVDGLWDHFNTGVDPATGAALRGIGSSAPLDNPQGGSLILQVANEVRRRGGNVTEEEFRNIVEELRQLMQNPPRRVNSKGRTVLDARERTARVAEIINRRVPEGAQRIYIPTALQRNLRNFGDRMEALRNARTAAEAASVEAQNAAAAPTSPIGAARTAPPAGGAAGGTPPAGNGGAGGAGGTGGTPPPSGGTPAPTSMSGALDMQENIPQLDRYDTLGFLTRFFNQSAVVLRYDNPAGRLAVWLGFNARRAAETRNGVRVAQGQTIFERGTYEMTGILADNLTAYRNGYIRFALNRGRGDRVSMADGLRAGFGRGRRAQRDAFDLAITEQLRTRAFNHANDGVNDAARQIADNLNRLHTLAHQAGLRGFQTSAVSRYMPRLWRWDRIARLGTTAEGRNALIDLLEQALGRTAGGRQVIMEDGTLQTLPDVRNAAVALTDRLINLSRDADLAPLLDTDDAIATAINGLLAPLTPGGVARTPFGRSRIIMDEMTDIVTPGALLDNGRSGLSIADLTISDQAEIMKRYTVSVMGAINEKRWLDAFNEQIAHFGIRGVGGAPVVAETFEQMRSIINDIGNLDSALGGSLGGQELDALREIHAAIRYEPLHRSNRELGSLGRVGNTITGSLLPLGYLATGGAFGLVATSEMSRIIGTLGLRSTLRQVPLLMEMVSNWNNMDEGARNFASLIDQAFHPATDRIRRTLMMQAQNQYGTEISRFERGLQPVSNFYSDITLLSPVTSFTQSLMTASTLQHLYDVSRGAIGRMDDATIRTLGLEPAQYDDIVDFVGNNAVTERRLFGERVVDLNDINHARTDNLRLFLDRAVRTRIQDMPTRGDFHRIGFSFLGRLMTQFRGFNLKGVDNFLFQNLSRVRRGDTQTSLRVGQEIVFTAVFAALIQYARNYTDAQSARERGDYEKAKEIEGRLLGVEGFVKGGLTGPSEFFLPIMATDAAYSTFIEDDPIFSPYRYSGLNWYGFPAASMVARTWDITKDVGGATAAQWLGLEDKEREITQKTVQKFRAILPFQNFVPVKHLFNIAEDEIVDEFNLREKQPRKQKKVLED